MAPNRPTPYPVVVRLTRDPLDAVTDGIRAVEDVCARLVPQAEERVRAELRDVRRIYPGPGMVKQTLVTTIGNLCLGAPLLTQLEAGLAPRAWAPCYHEPTMTEIVLAVIQDLSRGMPVRPEVDLAFTAALLPRTRPEHEPRAVLLTHREDYVDAFVGATGAVVLDDPGADDAWGMVRTAENHTWRWTLQPLMVPAQA